MWPQPQALITNLALLDTPSSSWSAWPGKPRQLKRQFAKTCRHNKLPRQVSWLFD
jgi:hypothetical protein